MAEQRELLRQAMRETGTSQTLLARMSGVHQPSISGLLSGRVDMSDDMLDRLLSCMGYQLEVVRRSVRPEMTRSSERSWRLHRQLSTHLTKSSFGDWLPVIERNLDRLAGSAQGQPHERNLERWRQFVRTKDISGIRRVMTGLDTDSIEMREVSPLGGLLSQEEREQALAA